MSFSALTRRPKRRSVSLVRIKKKPRVWADLTWRGRVFQSLGPAVTILVLSVLSWFYFEIMFSLCLVFLPEFALLFLIVWLCSPIALVFLPPLPSCVLSCDYPSVYLVLSSPVLHVGSLPFLSPSMFDCRFFLDAHATDLWMLGSFMLWIYRC